MDINFPEYDEQDMVDGYMVQRPQDEVVNIPGKAHSPLVQINLLDMTAEEELGWVDIYDPSDAIAAEQLHLVNQAGEQPVPAREQWWTPEGQAVPPVSESNPPPMPSGWIDPVTGELVP